MRPRRSPLTGRGVVVRSAASGILFGLIRFVFDIHSALGAAVSGIAFAALTGAFLYLQLRTRRHRDVSS